MASMTISSGVAPEQLNARSLLLPYSLGLLGLCAFIQLSVVVTGGQVGAIPTAMTVVAALYYAGFLFIKRQTLGQVRFAPLVAHAITFVVVTGSFQFHGAVATLAGSTAVLGDQDFAMDPTWFGATLAMTGFWSIGLTLHAIASIAQRGYEK